MNKILPGFVTAAPAAMLAGTIPMVMPNAPKDVQYGGVCLAAIAMILIDLKNGKKYGYTDKIVAAVRKVPGMKDADEGTVIGALCMGACGFLGGGAVNSMIESGKVGPDGLKFAYNATVYPLSALFDFKTTRGPVEAKIGKEIRLKYKDEQGNVRHTDPISTSDLMRQILLITGAAGITTYGTAIDVPAVQFTGIMFMLCNGLQIGHMTLPPVLQKLVKRGGVPTKQEIEQVGAELIGSQTINGIAAAQKVNPAAVAKALEGVVQEAGQQPPSRGL